MAVDTDLEPIALAQPGSADPVPEKSTLFLPLFLRHERRIYAYIFTLLPRRADADDVLQETSLVMWDKFEAASPPGDFLAWGRRIAYHKVLDFYKKSQRADARLSQLFLDRMAEAAADPAAAPQLEDRREALAGCLEKLPPDSRELLGYRFAEGATTETAAKRAGRSVEAMYKALAKIRQSLFDCVQRTLAQEAHA